MVDQAWTPSRGIVTVNERRLVVKLEIELTRGGRKRCGWCGQRRQLLRLTATGNDGLVGHGIALCGACAGLRR